MSVKNTTDLLNEQLGKKGTVEVFTTAAQTSKDYYAVYFVTESVISSIAADKCTGETALQTTIPAGTTLFMNVTAITLTSGLAVGYNN
jgi:hypothetical protein